MIICDYCGEYAILVSGASIYPHRPDLYRLQFWSCEACKAWVGCHKNTDAKPLGRLANAQLRMAKSGAHAAFDPIWKSGRLTRQQAYAWLSREMSLSREECHIGMFDLEQCQRVVFICATKAP
ncbi:hypothetical protein FL828_20415 [Salmonella enterica subsp. enterica]|nr:hypothetical protein [Salmonella enterica subsp. enterica serovar Stourbridge]HCI4072917.1 hypothetical protein [Salmonella enterica subsp. enterica serovar Infantis]HCI4149845.1 hypothetical protein [Salmonella enterica subsp. enterica serovar Infantis]